MITINLDYLNAEQLAKLYTVLMEAHLYQAAQHVREAGIDNCGEAEFYAECQRQKASE